MYFSLLLLRVAAMELSQLASPLSSRSVFVPQFRSSICRPRTSSSLSFPEIRQPKSLVSDYLASERRVLPVQRHVRCESLQEGQVGSVQESPAFVSRLEGGAEDNRQSGGIDDGLARAQLAVFVSGGGSNFRAIHAGCKKNAIHGDVAFVVSDKPGILHSLPFSFSFSMIVGLLYFC